MMKTYSVPQIMEYGTVEELIPLAYNEYLFPPADPSTETQMTGTAPQPLPQCKN